MIERFHRTWRAEVGSELPQGPLTLADLNERHTAWVTCEYHRRVHGMTNKEPLEDFLAGAHNHRPVPRWMVRMLEFESASWTFGRELPRVFREAGLPPPVMRADVDVASPGQPDSLVDRIRFVVPRLVEAGIPAEVIDLDTLAARLSAERDRVGAPWFADMAVAAWARTPAV